MLKITHPQIESQGSCTQAAFDRVWGPKGWAVVAEFEPTGDPAEDRSELYVPGDHTVEEVNLHLDTLDEDDPERERILDDEKSNKGRSGIIG